MRALVRCRARSETSDDQASIESWDFAFAELVNDVIFGILSSHLPPPLLRLCILDFDVIREQKAIPPGSDRSALHPQPLLRASVRSAHEQNTSY